jgi:hypothetical protein
MERNILVDVGQDSTQHGELLPQAWSADGGVSELYLMRGCTFEENVSKQSEEKDRSKTFNSTAKSETSTVLKDKAQLGTYVENLTKTNEELQRLHTSHVPKDSRTLSFNSILQNIGPDETLLAQVACSALINAPATGYDIVRDVLLVMTRVRSVAVPEAHFRRVYFFHVSRDLDNFDLDVERANLTFWGFPGN